MRQRHDCALVPLLSDGHNAPAGVAQPEILGLPRVALGSSFHDEQSAVAETAERRRTRRISTFLYHCDSLHRRILCPAHKLLLSPKNER